MHILIDGRTIKDKPSGVGYVVYNLLKNLASYHNLKLTVITQKGINKDFFHYPNKFVIHELNHSFTFFGLRRFVFEQIELIKLIKFYQPDVLHLTNSFGVPFLLDKQALKLKVILTIHDIIPYTKYWELMTRFERWLYKFSLITSLKKVDYIVAISQFTIKDIKKYFPHLKNMQTQVIPNGIDPINIPNNVNELWYSLCKKYNLTGDVIFYLGGFPPRKNVIRLVKAFNLLVKKGKINYQLVLSGRFSQNKDIKNNIKEITQYIHQENLEQKIILIDYLSPDEKAIFLRKAKFFSYLSLYEGFGLPVLEALSVETPVLTSKNSPMEEIGSEFAFYINPLDIEDIAKGMEDMVNNINIYKNKAIQAKKLLLPKYSWDKIVKKYYNIYKQIV